MPWFNGASKRVVCFIDDDPAETNRFERAMSSKFTCVTGQSYEQCKDKLRRDRLKPDAWVLDLFFPSPGHTNSQAQLDEMANRYAQLEQRVREFRAYLSSIGQGTEGGLSLLRRCKQDYCAPVIMFTRKGMLEDAIQCLDQARLPSSRSRFLRCWVEIQPTKPNSSTTLWPQERTILQAISWKQFAVARYGQSIRRRCSS
jgi:hypothetical protein